MMETKVLNDSRSRTADYQNSLSESAIKKIADAVSAKATSSEMLISELSHLAPAQDYVIGRHNSVSISIKGRFFKVEYSGHLPVHSYSISYGMSNEWFDDYTFKVVGGLRGIDAFTGITGGFSYPMSLVLNIQQNNELKSATFVDNDEDQLFHGMLMALRYDRMFSGRKTYKDRVPGLFLQNLEQLKPKGVTITFKNRDMVNELRNTQEKHKYLIYLSNAFYFNMGSISVDGWGDADTTTELLGVIFHNKSIEVGSCVMPLRAGSSDFLIIRKENNGFSLPYVHRVGEEVYESDKRAFEKSLRRL